MKSTYLPRYCAFVSICVEVGVKEEAGLSAAEKGFTSWLLCLGHTSEQRGGKGNLHQGLKIPRIKLC